MKTRSESDSVGSMGECFIQMKVDEMKRGAHCIWGGEKTPGLDGVIRLADPIFKTHLSVGIQVKTGQRYIQGLNGKADHVFLRNLERAHISDWKNSPMPVIVVWVSSDDLHNRYAFWVDAMKCKGKTKKAKVSRNALFNVDAYEDLLQMARKHVGFPTVRIIDHPPLCASAIKVAKQKAWQFYRSWRKESPISPVFGPITISLRCWRHITRVGLSEREIIHKLSLLSCARELIIASIQARFLRLLEDSDARGGYRNVVRELHSISGMYVSHYQSDILVEVVIEVKRAGRRTTNTLYSIQEVRQQRYKIPRMTRRQFQNNSWIEF